MGQASSLPTAGRQDAYPTSPLSSLVIAGCAAAYVVPNEVVVQAVRLRLTFRVCGRVACATRAKPSCEVSTMRISLAINRARLAGAPDRKATSPITEDL